MNRLSLRYSGLMLGTALAMSLLLTAEGPLWSDPCGMVPPIYTGPGTPIERTGLQQTYVYFEDGVESFVIRPAFRGRVDNFGMLIPFPSPPSLRKVPDNVFDQIAAAVDPPEVVIDMMPRLEAAMAPMGGGAGGGGMMIERKRVRVIKEEAVGMYEVAVLEAGSADALKRWMDQHQYQYPEGMDDVAEEYIEEKWCFVAVKTRVGSKESADPRPGQRKANPAMPAGGVFDGTVQGLGFRFRTPELVVPMRLSAFNPGDLRNVVYLLTRGAKKIEAIPEEYVVRQVTGKQLVKNLTEPLQVRLISMDNNVPARLPQWVQQRAQDRDPGKHNGVAKQIFVSDVIARGTPDMALDHEETEKELLRISEHLQLRGTDIDRHIESISRSESEQSIAKALPRLEGLTLTVVDGDFPREVLANQNLTFAAYQMDAELNRPEKYDTRLHKPAPKKPGRLISHVLTPDGRGIDPLKFSRAFPESNRSYWSQRPSELLLRSLMGLALCSCFGWVTWRRVR